MPHSHADPGWQKTTNEYYTDQTKHIFTHMVNKLTQHPDLAFVWAETIYLSLWWNELEDAVKVCVWGEGEVGGGRGGVVMGENVEVTSGDCYITDITRYSIHHDRLASCDSYITVK